MSWLDVVIFSFGGLMVVISLVIASMARDTKRTPDKAVGSFWSLVIAAILTVISGGLLIHVGLVDAIESIEMLIAIALVVVVGLYDILLVVESVSK